VSDIFLDKPVVDFVVIVDVAHINDVFVIDGFFDENVVVVVDGVVLFERGLVDGFVIDEFDLFVDVALNKTTNNI
jgi:hypothetical protein